MSASFPYKKVLMVGATSGIGRALADKMIAAGISVIGVGRRQEQLDEFVKAGGSNASASQFDITNIAEIPKWAASIHKEHPDLDFVLMNSGIQRAFNFAQPDSVDLQTVETEFNTNYLSYIHMSMAFLPYLQEHSKNSPAAIGYTTSGLAIIPMMRCANYCASKAALHHWILVLREQLRQGPGNVKCIEILPPAVQTELHDKKHQPDLGDSGRSIGMPLDEFTDKAWTDLLEGKLEIPVGLPAPHFEAGGCEAKRQEAFRVFNKIEA